MNNPNPEQVRKFFAASRALPKEERAEWLSKNVADVDLRREVEELLNADVDDSFLASPAVISISNLPLDVYRDSENRVRISKDEATQTYHGEMDGSHIHQLIGEKFRVLQKIGEGGFGDVFMAEQTIPVRRKVAIKILKPGLDSKNIIARFEAERQALAIMDHPNIAKVFDGGITIDGRPYFVMELVNGVAITEFCASGAYSIREKMILMVDVCLAIQHAHQKGVIHRDVKPSNVLVHEVDGRVAPIVIDFGIAKAIHTPLTDRTLFTEFRQMIGTPEYMSPEQSKTSAVDADTRSDVYALGILLYELLTGTTPLDGRELRRLGIAEIQKTIQESEAPSPSQRLSTILKTQSKDEQPGPIAGLKQFPIDSQIDRDLDWIVMKAIEKDRQRRYPTAIELSADLVRWLNGDPIEARPPSMAYKATKWLKKHKTFAMVAISLILSAFVAAVSVGYGVAQRLASVELQTLSKLQVEQASEIARIDRQRAESLAYGNAMIAASESFITGRKSITRQLLSECPSSQRGLEWNSQRGLEWKWLSHWSSDQSTILETRSKIPVRDVCFLGESENRILSIGDDGTCRIWDTVERREERTWKVSDVPCTKVVSSVYRSAIVTGNQDGEVVVWSMTGERKASKTFGTEVTALSLSPDNQRLGIGCIDGSAYIIAFPSLEELFSFPVSPRYRGQVQSVVFDDVGEKVLVAGKGGIRCPESSSKSSIEERGNYWQSYGIVANRKSREIVAFGPPISIWSMESDEQIREWSLPETGIRSAISVPGSDSIILATEEGVIRQLDTTTGSQQTLGYGDQGTIHNMAISQSSNKLAIAGDDGTIRIWDRNKFASVRFAAESNGIAQVAWTANNHLVSLSTAGMIESWSIPTLFREWQYRGFDQQGFTLTSNPRTERIVAGGYPPRLLTWENAKNAKPKELSMGLGVRFFVMHPNSPWIAGPMSTIDSDYQLAGGPVENPGKNPTEGQIALWDLNLNRVIRVFSGLKNWSLGLAFNESGSQLAAASVEGAVLIWNVDSGVLAMRTPTEQIRAPKQVCFTRDGKCLLIGTADGTVLVWDIKSNQATRKIVCHGDEVTALVVSSDGSRLLTSSRSDSRVRVWNWSEGQKVLEFDSGLPGILDLRFNMAETSLCVAGSDQGCRIFRLSPDGTPQE